MGRARWTGFLAGCALMGAAACVARQTVGAPDADKLRPWQRPGAVPDQVAAAPAPSTARSTLSGVYTVAQAGRGKVVYLEACQSCHGEQADIELDIARVWGGQRLSELFSYSLSATPRNNPGSLRPQQYADVIAYLLSLKDVPAGTQEIPPADSLLRDIRIDIPAKAP